MFAKPDHIYFLAERAARRLILQMGQRRLKARDRQDLGFRAMFRPPPHPGASTLPLFSPSSSSHKGVLWLLPFSDPLRGLLAWVCRESFTPSPKSQLPDRGRDEGREKGGQCARLGPELDQPWRAGGPGQPEV